MILSRLLLAALVTLMLTGVLSAQDEEPARVAEHPGSPGAVEDEIVILATRLDRALGNTGASVTVTTKEDFQARQTRQAGEALRPTPGAFLASGTPGAATSLFIRGAASNQTVVLVDGVQVNDPTLGGQYNFYDLGILNFSSMEVLRGSSSTLYGTDAMGGVVNFVTERGSGTPRARAELEGGSFGYYRALAGAIGAVGPLSFNIAGARLASENELDNDAFMSDTFAGSLAWQPLDNLLVSLSGRWIDSEKQDPWDFPFGPQIEEDDNIVRDRTTGLASLRVDHDVSDLFSWCLAGWLFDVRSDLNNGGDLPGDPDELDSTNIGKAWNVTGTVQFQFADVTDWLDVTTILGGEIENESSESRVTTNWGPQPDVDMTLRNRAAFALLELVTWDRFTLSGGLRRDKNSFYGYRTTGSASALYHLESTGTRVRANYGQGFRGPRPVEFSDPFVGNPDLKPESSVSVDVGVEQDFMGGDLVLGVTYFDLKIKDLIAWDPGTGVLENFRKAETTGLEFSMRLRPAKGWEVLASFTAQDPRNESAEPGEERRLPGRPTRFGSGEVRYRSGVWFAGLTVYASDDYVGTGRITPDGDVRNHPGRKLLVALLGRVDITEDLAFTLRIENLLDYEWYDSEIAPNGLGRGGYLGIEARF